MENLEQWRKDRAAELRTIADRTSRRQKLAELHETDDYKKVADERVRPKFHADMVVYRKHIDQILQESLANKQNPQRGLENLFRYIEKRTRANSELENMDLLNFAEELDQKVTARSSSISGDTTSAVYAAIGRMIDTTKMTKEQVLSLMYKIKSLAFCRGLLDGGGVERLELDKMDNDSIIELGQKMLHDFIDPDMTYISDREIALEGSKTHIAYMLWTPIFKYLKFEETSLQKVIDFGIKHNESYLWREIYNRKRDELKVLSPDERLKIAHDIAQAYGPKVGIDTNSSDVYVWFGRVVNYGGPVSRVLTNLTEQ